MADIHDQFENEQDLSKQFENEPGAQKTNQELMQAGYNFDDFNKLSPQEKSRLQDLQKKDSGENAEALGRGAAQGATLGFQDELSPLVERTFAKMFGDEGVKELYANKSYEDLRDTYRQQNADARNKAPVAYTIGQLAGATPLALATGAAGSALGKGIQASTGLGTLASQTAGQAAAGAALGGAQGAGYTQGQFNGTPEEQAQAIKDTAKGAAIGGAVPLALGGAAAGAQALASPAGQEATASLAEPIQETANTQAVKSLNPTASQLADLTQKGRIQGMGQELLDKDLIPTMSTASGRAQGIQQAQQAAGQNISKNLQGLDQNVAKTMTSAEDSTSVNTATDALKRLQNQAQQNLSASESELNNQSQQLMQKIQQQPQRADLLDSILDKNTFVDDLQNQTLEVAQNAGQSQEVQETLQNLLDQMRQVGGENSSIYTLESLNNLKQIVRQGVNYNNSSSQVQQAVKDFSSKLNNMILDKGQQLDEIYGTNFTDPLTAANKSYGLLEKAKDMAFTSAAKSDLTSSIGKGAVGGAIGKTVGGTPGEVIGTIAGTTGNVAKTAINRFTANTLNTVAGAVRQSPQTFGQFAQPLQDALTRGPEAFSAMIFTLQQRDPEFREKYNNLLDSQPSNPEAGAAVSGISGINK